jgi:hypothetical protein
MRFLVQVEIPVEAGNAALLDGSLMPKIQRYLGEVKPEAVYYFAANGQRTIYLFLNIQRPEQLPEITEPLWLDMKANVNVVPAMNAEDFEKAGAGIQRVLQARK